MSELDLSPREPSYSGGRSLSVDPVSYGLDSPRLSPDRRADAAEVQSHPSHPRRQERRPLRRSHSPASPRAAASNGSGRESSPRRGRDADAPARRADRDGGGARVRRSRSPRAARSLWKDALRQLNSQGMVPDSDMERLTREFGALDEKAVDRVLLRLVNLRPGDVRNPQGLIAAALRRATTASYEARRGESDRKRVEDDRKRGEDDRKRHEDDRKRGDDDRKRGDDDRKRGDDDRRRHDDGRKRGEDDRKRHEDDRRRQDEPDRRRDGGWDRTEGWEARGRPDAFEGSRGASWGPPARGYPEWGPGPGYEAWGAPPARGYPPQAWSRGDGPPPGWPYPPPGWPYPPQAYAHGRRSPSPPPRRSRSRSPPPRRGRSRSPLTTALGALRPAVRRSTERLFSQGYLPRSAVDAGMLGKLGAVGEEAALEANARFRESVHSGIRSPTGYWMSMLRRVRGGEGRPGGERGRGQGGQAKEAEDAEMAEPSPNKLARAPLVLEAGLARRDERELERSAEELRSLRDRQRRLGVEV